MIYDIGVDKKQFKISGHNKDYNVFNIPALIEQLELINFDDEVEEMSEDDFEDNFQRGQTRKKYITEVNERGRAINSHQGNPHLKHPFSQI